MAVQAAWAGEQLTSKNPTGEGNQEVGGSVFEDMRAGIYVATFQPPGEPGAFSVNLSNSDVPSYGDFLGFWHSQVGNFFSRADDGYEHGYSFYSWVGTPEGQVFMNYGTGAPCTLVRTNTGPVGGSYPSC